MTTSAKVLQFPLAGLARDLDYRKAYIPSEQATFATPLAVNVLGNCPFADRRRGGSRPGLKAFSGTQPSAAETVKWLWPNGDVICWSGTDVSHIIADDSCGQYLAPDGSVMLTQHETFSVGAAKGAVPSDLSVMAMFKARLVVAKDTMWYASRMGDVTDFDYGADGDDVARAAAGNVALAGRTGENITALMPVDDRYLFIATKRQVRMVDGDLVTGTVTKASEQVGVISRDAWCYTGDALYFIGNNGLYGMIAGQAPQLVSSRLPEDFKGFTSATLVWDVERRGIHIFALRGTTRSDWFYDTDQKAFWPMEYAAAKAPLAGYAAIIDNVNKIVFKCADGTWRYLDDAQATDDGTTITSKVAIGPVRTSARDDMDGMVAEMSATLAESSADVTVSIYTAHSPEAAVSLANSATATPFTYTAKAGFNNVTRPRKRGAWAVVVLTATGRWGYESITSTVKQFGRLR